MTIFSARHRAALPTPARRAGDEALRRLCVWVLVLSCALRVWFWRSMPIDASWHDIGSMAGLHADGFGNGHLGYIEYLYKYHALPGFDLTLVHSFYNPPLYHVTAALVMTLFSALGLPEAAVLHAVTLVPCVCMCLTAWVCLALLRELPMPESVRAVLFLLLAFHPSTFWLAVTPTNDALCLLLTLLAVLYTLRWYRLPLPAADAAPRARRQWRRRNLAGLVRIALAIGFGMMAKLSAVLIAPAIALVFLLRLRQARRGCLRPMLASFCAFACVSLPLGLWWPVRSWLRWHIPLSYVQGDDSGATYFSAAGGSAAARLGLPTRAQLVALRLTSDDLSANIWLQLVKTSLYDEHYLTDVLTAPKARFLTALLCLALALAVWFFVLFVRALCRRGGLNAAQRLLLGGGWAVIMASFVRFCFIYPFGYTANFRYIFAAFVLGIAGAGPALGSWPGRAGRWVRRGTAAGVLVFVLASTAAYCLWFV